MKQLLLIWMLMLCALAMMSCTGNPEQSSTAEEETTSSVTTTTTEAVKTTATTKKAKETETTTTAAEKDIYETAENLSVNVIESSIRASKCTVKMINTAEEQQPYTFGYRILDAETGEECRVLADYEPDDDENYEHWIKPNETRDLKYHWEERYGDLTDGDYIIELNLKTKTVWPEDGGDAQTVHVTVRADFHISSEGFVPKVYIAPENITPTGVVLTIENSPDTGRSYALVYKLYDESTTPRSVVLREFDKKTQLAKNNYVKAGETLLLDIGWAESFGPLLEGKYAIEIEMLADGEHEGKTYHAEFEIK